MAIPDFQSIMRPLIEAHTDGKEHINRDLVRQLADQFDLTEEERREKFYLPDDLQSFPLPWLCGGF
jgi:restriction endonuclease Mrr